MCLSIRVVLLFRKLHSMTLKKREREMLHLDHRCKLVCEPWWVYCNRSHNICFPLNLCNIYFNVHEACPKLSELYPTLAKVFLENGFTLSMMDLVCNGIEQINICLVTNYYIKNDHLSLKLTFSRFESNTTSINVHLHDAMHGKRSAKS